MNEKLEPFRLAEFDHGDTWEGVIKRYSDFSRIKDDCYFDGFESEEELCALLNPVLTKILMKKRTNLDISRISDEILETTKSINIKIIAEVAKEEVGFHGKLQQIGDNYVFLPYSLPEEKRQDCLEAEVEEIKKRLRMLLISFKNLQEEWQSGVLSLEELLRALGEEGFSFPSGDLLRYLIFKINKNQVESKGFPKILVFENSYKPYNPFLMLLSQEEETPLEKDLTPLGFFAM